MGLWIFFGLLVVAVMALDLGLFNRSAHVPKFKEALGWSITWSTLALSFMAVVHFFRGPGDAMDFLTGYLIEWSLSVDNIFIFLLIFDYFQTPASYQHRILFWGVLGALVMRAVFIAAGTALIQNFEWILYLFGLILVVSGWKMMKSKGVEVHPEKNLFIRLARKLFPVEIGYEIASEYRNRGLATEAAQGMITYAFAHPEVTSVEAHTSAEPNPSSRVLEKVGMGYVRTLYGTEDGDLWHWRITRQAFQARCRPSASPAEWRDL